MDASWFARLSICDVQHDMYNHQRPHEGIGMVVHVSHYRPSERMFPDTPAPMKYGPNDHVLTVKWDGKVVFKGHRLIIIKVTACFPQVLHLLGTRILRGALSTRAFSMPLHAVAVTHHF